jgi:hypothetical protein
MTAYPGQTRTTLGQLWSALWDSQSLPDVMQPGSCNPLGWLCCLISLTSDLLNLVLFSLSLSLSLSLTCDVCLWSMFNCTDFGCCWPNTHPVAFPHLNNYIPFTLPLDVKFHKKNSELAARPNWAIRVEGPWTGRLSKASEMNQLNNVIKLILSWLLLVTIHPALLYNLSLTV